MERVPWLVSVSCGCSVEWERKQGECFVRLTHKGVQEHPTFQFHRQTVAEQRQMLNELRRGENGAKWPITHRMSADVNKDARAQRKRTLIRKHGLFAIENVEAFGEWIKANSANVHASDYRHCYAVLCTPAQRTALTVAKGLPVSFDTTFNLTTNPNTFVSFFVHATRTLSKFTHLMAALHPAPAPLAPIAPVEQEPADDWID